ncbi:Centromere protein Scm3 N-terminal [Penicillium bovifimosum]|uniref:Centromere protein Scm3 N-terminal n=1 Tax=Penicillium bovifimosum TaxID=126998 RepID=A0A9W9KXP2_9EURO|nr:Centromere protein Scm3 N-terminal [Penicillium bovifimosum]KAJ5124930.1 Centromere protein Scm3 N-terminal [Penicillium bovifimosum]
MDNSIDHDMERPAKRPCLSNTPSDEGELPPDFDLPAARAQNDSRLKSLFEGIFAKYSHDFTDVGDEIDLATGDIVVDNGHLMGLRAEDDTGEHPRSWLLRGDLAGPEDSDADNDDDGSKGEEEDFFSMTPTPPTGSPDLRQGAGSASREPQANTNGDDPLDFVFTFKASGATGLSPVPKEPYFSRPINPIAITKPASKPRDPLWDVPDLPQSFSTPTTETRKKNVSFTPTVKSPSPPGSGSIWAVAKRGRPRSETKPKAPPKKRQPAAKRKYHSSPVTRDWSFAAVPDGDESDDPLQDYEPSPTPSKMKIVRGKRRVPTKDHDGPSEQREDTPSKNPARAIEAAVQNDNQGVGHGGKDADKQKEDVPRATPRDVPVDTEAHDHGDEDAGKQRDGAPKSTPKKDVPLEPTLQDNSTPKTGPKVLSTQSPDNTPSKRCPMTPDEAKLIVSMMHKQGKKVMDVMPMLPGRGYHSIWYWFYAHWTRRLTNPPPLSAPWTQPELEALSRLSTESGLSWPRIHGEFKGRSRNEVEFELLRAFVAEGFTAGIRQNTEGHVEEQQPPGEEQEVQIKEESDSEVGFGDAISRTSSGEDEIKEESDSEESLDGYSRDSLADTAEDDIKEEWDSEESIEDGNSRASLGNTAEEEIGQLGSWYPG